MYRLEFKNVTKKFEDDFVAIEDVSFGIDKGGNLYF